MAPTLNNISKIPLLGLTLSELYALVASHGWPSFTAKQIAGWLYKKNISSVNEMTNLSAKIRQTLNEKYTYGTTQHTEVQTSVDGTKKYLYPVAYKKFIEAAYIPDKERATLCLSSQVGCKMGCLFCMTAKQGFQAHLSAGQIINQVKSLPERDKLTNLVYMGMGEPFDNTENVLKSLEIFTSDYGFEMSPKRITVSTIGIIPGMKEFLQKSKCHLAVSLHTPFDDERKKLMPIQSVYPVKQVIEAIQSFEMNRQRRISFEYIMFAGINDTAQHIKELCRILNKVKCRINLIKFHPIPNSPLKGSDNKTMENFRDKLNSKGITATIRASRGEDILAACGLLSTKRLLKQSNTDY